MSSGMKAQLGVAAESVYGTIVTPTRFYPLVSESLTAERARLDSDGIIAGARVRRTGQWSPGNVMVSGDIGLEMYQQDAALLWSYMLGGISSSTAGGVATHTATPGDMTGKSLTVQVGRPDVTNVVRPFTYSGVKIEEWELSLAADKIATLGLSVIGQDETTSTALAAATFGADSIRPYTFIHGAVSIGGTAVDVRAITLKGKNNLSDDRMRLGSATLAEPLEADIREYTGTITMEFNTLAQYNRYVSGAEFSVALTMSASPSASIVITTNARYDGDTPAIDGRGLVVVEHPIVLIGAGSDASAITATIRNSQTAP